MAERLPRYRTDDDDLDQRLLGLLDDLGATENRDQLFEILVSAVGLATDDVDRLDLKITNAALKEMRGAFRAFRPYHGVPKCTIFGSARTHAKDPLYLQARDLAGRLAGEGWMVVTGAGPGIMAAGLEGAGREKSFGVNIRLPFEQTANEFIVGDEKLISMKYFFTRKLMLMKESHGFVVLPGGFGTQDEAFELLTLEQTGKAQPAPIVLLDVPGGTYWVHWRRFIEHELLARGLVSAEDTRLFRITDDVTAACDELIGFYRNYHSLRYVGSRLVIRLKAAPTDEELSALSDEFAGIVTSGGIERTEALPAEREDDDHVDLPRVVLRFDRHHFSGLRRLIDALNGLSSAPAVTPAPPVDRER
jgi:uncharacterized protein (TIGR00730 family)